MRTDGAGDACRPPGRRPRAHPGRTPAHPRWIPEPRQVRARLGLTLLELLVTVAVAALVMAGLAGVVGQALETKRASHSHHERLREARFALERMARAVGRAQQLVLPLAQNPATPWSESVRDVLATTLDPTLDRDGDGFADADNDRDGEVDEDPGADLNADGAAGILGIDDDGDGQVDESNQEDDDEDEDQTGNKDEEILNGLDDDGDGAVDEDLSGDLEQDGKSGEAGEDDDDDGSTDESNQEDDDEDEDQRGTKNEDGWDTVVYFLQGTSLIERLPNPHATSGLDYAESPVAADVSEFRVERLARKPNERAPLVEITLEVGGPGPRAVRLVRRVRVGGEL